jgi:hypothetical protein
VDHLTVAEGTGIAFASPMFGGGPTVTAATATIPTTVLTTLTQGRHTLWVRGHDAAGNWGVVGSTTLTLSTTGPVTTSVVLAPNPTTGFGSVAITATGNDSGLGGTVTAAEYFIDAAGTSGAGSAMTLSATGASIVDETGTIPVGVVAALAEGRHIFLVHTRDSFGLWGPYGSVDLVVDRTIPVLLSGAILPSATNGVIGSPSDPTDLRINAAFNDPVGGGVQSTIAAAEGFLDTGSADGTGITLLALDGTFNGATESTFGLVPLTEMTALADGQHQILVHAKDSAGNWGPLAPVSFLLDRHGPVVTSVSATPNPTAGAATLTLLATATDAVGTVAGGEWYEGTAPSLGSGHPMTVSGTGLSATIGLGGFAAGAHTLWVRARDALGNWSAPVSVTVTVQPPNVIFADTFSGSTAAWSQTVGTASAASGALVASGLGYVVDNTPSGERSFFARFDLTVGSFNARTATVDIFQARGAAGTAVLTVQVRRNGTVTQVRLGLLRSTGWTYTGWVTTTGGTVRVSWSSAAAGSASLRVGTTLVGTLSGNTSASTVESAALGLVARTNTTPTGSATFDNYASTRVTAP